MRRFRTSVSPWLCVWALAGGVPSLARASEVEPTACQPVSLVKSIAPGAASSIPDYDFQPPAVLGRTVFFAASDGKNGLELWKSRGTEAGTALVKDVFPGDKDADPRSLTVVDGTLFFIADDGAHGRELWKTDGTADGTVLVKDIRPGVESSGAASLTAVGRTLFFVADDGVHGPELWTSDGTEAGTVLVKDLVPGAQGSGLGSLAALGDTLYFAADGGPHEAELWKSNGTGAGTERVAVIRVIESDPGEQLVRGLTAVGNTLYFFAGSPYGAQWDLWKSDGTGQGTVRVRTLTLSPEDYTAGPVTMTPSGGLVYFRSGDGGSLWRSDGTPTGTFVVRHASDARWLTDLGGKLLFTSWDDASGYELWRSDGTVAGTAMVEDIRSGGDSSAPFWLTAVDGKVLFSAETAESGRELWSSDGTRDGTRLLQELVPGTASVDPSWLTPVGPRVFFIATDAATGSEPWVLNDCTPPELACPSALDVEATGPGGANVAYPPATARDDKPQPPTVVYSLASGVSFPIGNSEVTATATDESGNTTRCSFSVRVRDTTPPALTCPQSQWVWRGNSFGARVKKYPQAQAWDSVSVSKVSYDPPPGSLFAVGTTPVTVTATDAAGNQSRCVFQMEVKPEYEASGCGCGAATPGGLSAGAALAALAVLAGRRRKA